MTFIRLLRRFLAPYAVSVWLVVGLLLFQSIGNLFLPNLNADLINNGVAVGNINYIWRTGLIMLAITAALGVISIAAVYLASRISMGVGRDIRTSVFSAVQTFSQVEMNRFGPASLITRNTNDVQQLQIFLQMALTMMVVAPIMAVGGIFMAIHENVTLSSLLIVVIPLMAAVILIVFSRAVPLFQTMQKRIDRINLILREQIMGIRVIRAFVQTHHEQERFRAANLDLTQTALTVNRIFVLAFPAMMGILYLTNVAVIWFGGHLVDSGSMPIGNIFAFLNYILQILMSVLMATMMVILVPRAVASGDRLMEVISTSPSIVTPKDTVTPTTKTGEVTFEHVDFGYQGGEELVLRNISFTCKAGTTTGIIGGTGSGKSTILSLIPRLFDVTNGTLHVDGVDVRRRNLEEMWQEIGFVPQFAYLFRGSVADNLRVGNPHATEQEMWHALEVAQARDFIEAMPGKLEGAIDQGGTNVSGGQRQRLAIARAIIRNPKLYLFDDCFSALDASTDARLRSALNETTSNATVIIVSQRVSTIMHASSIIVLDEGAIVGIGSHEELLRTCQPYEEIVVSQLGKEHVA
ncbi:MAG: ABC transporter ATP-binding protein [Candidatus Dormibacteria bacterium]